jgi:hypothetical protein
MELGMEKMKNLPFFDFYESIENYGFDFDIFQSDGFAKFIRDIYIGNFINFRKAFIMKDFYQLKFYAHKFKGTFLYEIKYINLFLNFSAFFSLNMLLMNATFSKKRSTKEISM